MTMVGSVGTDVRGEFLLEGLEADGIDHRHVQRVATPTGVAVITVDPDDVSIVVVTGANAETGEALVDAAADAIAGADALLLQGEVPAAAAAAAARIARAGDTLVVFNPAPFNEVAAAVAPLADVVMVNRQEAQELGDIGVPILVTTLGAEGCEVAAADRSFRVAAPSVEVVDPTGAGDTFAAAFAVRYVETRDPQAAARFAVEAGALAVTVAGAQPSLPTREAVDARLAG